MTSEMQSFSKPDLIYSTESNNTCNKNNNNNNEIDPKIHSILSEEIENAPNNKEKFNPPSMPSALRFPSTLSKLPISSIPIKNTQISSLNSPGSPSLTSPADSNHSGIPKFSLNTSTPGTPRRGKVDEDSSSFSYRAHNGTQRQASVNLNTPKMRHCLPKEKDDMTSRVNRMSLDLQSTSLINREHDNQSELKRLSAISPDKCPTTTERKTSFDEKSHHSSSTSNQCSPGSYLSSPTPDCGIITARIGSLANIKHKPAGGDIKIYDQKLEIHVERGKCGTLENIKYTAGGGNVQIFDEKLEIKAESKVGSFNNIKHKPQGGDIKILSKKLSFNDTSSKIGSLDRADYTPKGGDKKIFNEQLPWLRHNKPNLSEEEKKKINKQKS